MNDSDMAGILVDALCIALAGRSEKKELYRQATAMRKALGKGNGKPLYDYLQGDSSYEPMAKKALS